MKGIVSLGVKLYEKPHRFKSNLGELFWTTPLLNFWQRNGCKLQRMKQLFCVTCAQVSFIMFFYWSISSWRYNVMFLINRKNKSILRRLGTWCLKGNNESGWKFPGVLQKDFFNTKRGNLWWSSTTGHCQNLKRS